VGKITREDSRIVIKALRVEKNWSSRRFLKEFASKAWCRSTLDRLIKTIDAGLPVDGVTGRSRRRPVRTAANVARVEELMQNSGHIEHVVQLAVDICTLAMLFVADVIRNKLFAGVQHVIFFQVVCLRQSC